MKEKPGDLGLITFPLVEAGNIPLSNLTAILYSISGKLCVITGREGKILFKKQNDDIRVFSIQYKAKANLLARASNYLFTQIKITLILLKLIKDVDTWVFFIGGEALVLPMITAKLLRKDVIIVSAGSGIKDSNIFNDPLTGILTYLYMIGYHLADKIVLCSKRLIEIQSLQKYKDKIFIAQHHFLDFDKFKINIKLNERDHLIGYVGRLSEEKGTFNFVNAIPNTLQKKYEVAFIIVGDGQLRVDIEKYLIEHNLNEKVKMAGWISHDNLPQYLNKMKLIVLPSYTEGLPNVMLEAMACGTPILATAVGAIPDFISDCDTGFILENNSPECIGGNILRVLNYPGLEQIAIKAKSLVEKEFSFEVAAEKLREILVSNRCVHR